MRGHKYVVNIDLLNGKTVQINKIGWDKNSKAPEDDRNTAIILVRLINHIDRLREDGEEFLVIAANDFGAEVGIRAIKHAAIVDIRVDYVGELILPDDYQPNIYW